MAENLRVTTYNDGSKIPGVHQLDKEDKDATRWGRLYEWTSLHQASGICPRGWRVPSDKDFNRLEAAVGMSPETIAKTGWRHTNDEGLKLKKYDYAFSYSDEKKKKINQTGFSAIPSGVRRMYWVFEGRNQGNYGDLWASTEFNKEKAWSRTFVWMAVHWASNQIRRKAVVKDWAFAIRCMKDS